MAFDNTSKTSGSRNTKKTNQETTTDMYDEKLEIRASGPKNFTTKPGKNLIKGFNPHTGDQLILPRTVNEADLSFSQKGDDAIITAKGFSTVVKGVTIADIVKGIVKRVSEKIESHIPIRAKGVQTVLNTGLIVPGINGKIQLPTQDKLNKRDVDIYPFVGKKLSGNQYTVEDNTITIDDARPGYYKIAAKFDWENSYQRLWWMRDVLQFGDKDKNGTPDPIEGKYAFMGFMGDDISASEDISIGDSDSTYQMFSEAFLFNGNLDGLLPEGNQVEDMYSMFRHAARFNNGGEKGNDAPGINNWDTSKVERMRMMFWNNLQFNQDISGWDTSSVVDDMEGGDNGGMSRMFKDTPSFDQDLSSWNTSNLYGNLQTDFNTNLAGFKVDQAKRYPKTALPSFGETSPYASSEYVLRTRNLRGPLGKQYLTDGEIGKGKTGEFTIKLPLVPDSSFSEVETPSFDQNIEGSSGRDRLNGGDGNDLINGGRGRNTLKGGRGGDVFELSDGNNVIKDFDRYEGDQIALPKGSKINLQDIRFAQKGKDTLITVKDKFETTVLKSNVKEVISTFDIHESNDSIDDFDSELTVLKTGIIVNGINNTITLPAKAIDKLSIYDGDGNELTKEESTRRGGGDYTVDGNEITFKGKVPFKNLGTFTIAAEFDWDNTGNPLLLWLKDVTQLGVESSFEPKQAFRGYMGKGLTAKDEMTSKVADKADKEPTSFYEMFAYAPLFNVELNGLMPKNSQVDDMYGMFKFNAMFNNGGKVSIGKWATKNVKRMRQTFWNAFSFNQDLSKWNTKNVIDDLEGGDNGGMMRMFKNTPKFNQDLSAWNTQNLYANIQTDFNTNFTGLKADQTERYGPEDKQPDFGGGSPFEDSVTVLRTQNLRQARYRKLIDGGNYALQLPAAPGSVSGGIQVINNNGVPQDVTFDSDSSTLFIPESGASQYTISIDGMVWDNSAGADDASTSNASINNLHWLNDVIQFGDVDGDGDGDIASGIAAFAGYGGQYISDLNNLDTSNLTSAYRMFSEAYTFNQELPEGFIHEGINDLFAMFTEAGLFNNGQAPGATGETSTMSGWDTSNVTNMRQMFQSALSFNQDISDWETSSIDNLVEAGEDPQGGMKEMFQYTPMFKQNLSCWDVEQLDPGDQEPFNTNALNKPKDKEKNPRFGEAPPTECSGVKIKVIDNNGKDLSNESQFNVKTSELTIPTSGANQYTISVDGMVWDNSEGANDASTENKTINELRWLGDVIQFGDVDNDGYGDIASGIAAFTGYGGQGISDLNNLDVTKLNSAYRMFYDARQFNQRLPEKFIHGGITDLFSMFGSAYLFNNGQMPGASGENSSLATWDTDHVTDMRQMFQSAEAFNQDISDWKTYSVVDGKNNNGGMQNMFNYTQSFNQDLSDWQVENLNPEIQGYNKRQGYDVKWFNTNLLNQPKGDNPKFGEAPPTPDPIEPIPPTPPTPPSPSPDNGGGGGSGGGNSGGGNSGGSDDGGKPGGGIDDAPGGGDNGGGGGSGGGNSGGGSTIDGNPINPPNEPEPDISQLPSVDLNPSPNNSAFEAVMKGTNKPDNVNGGKEIDKLTGQKKNDILNGKGGADYLMGGNGRDTLNGAKGPDVLEGGRGDDILNGGDGKDMLYGGDDNDILTGNKGKDIFILSPGKDVVSDFKLGIDSIGLVYALDLTLTQQGNDLRIKGNDGVNTLLEGINKDDFLAGYPDNLEEVSAVEINLI